jgi:ABC-2 type transport system ATP-binding protein
VSEPAIEVKQLVKRFGAKTALNELTFTVEQGQCYGLIGPNGAGKTTTFSILCGFLHPTSGEARILGTRPTTPGGLKRKVGVLPQDAILTPTERVGPLLTYYATLSQLEKPEQEARSALDKVGLADTWNTRAGALSHGMAKRVALAQGIMGAPPVVMLDEPTAGLDPRIAAQVRQIIRDMKGRQTVLVSSHNLQELEELCDAAAILDHGKLAQAGSMAELTAQSAEFRIQIARGDVPLDVIRALRGCSGASFESGWLAVQFNSQQISAEEMISQTVKTVLDRGALILAVTRGRKLEERVLQLT